MNTRTESCSPAHRPSRRPALFSLLTLGLLAFVGCGTETTEGPEGLGSLDQALAISGPWNPPASTRNLAAQQQVTVVDPPAVAPLGYCTSSNPFQCSCSHPACSPAHPGTVELDRYLRQRWPHLSSGGLYCCRQNSATTSVPKLSVHAIGRAIDLMVTTVGGDADNGAGDPAANWLVENAEFIGVQRVIWDKVYWNGERGFGLLSSASSPHTNHLHIELSQAGAAKLTPFFTSGASTGSCTAHCEGSRLIAANCASTDCAATGTQCLPSPAPRCGTPPPPEPPEARAVAGAPRPSVSTVGGPDRFTFLPPRRLFDTRTASASAGLQRSNGSRSGPVLSSGANTYSDLSSGPLDTASSAWINLAAIPGNVRGFLSVARGTSAAPETSTLNFAPGRVRANATPVVLGNGGTFSIHTSTEVDVVADLVGVLADEGLGLLTAGPTRVLDTRGADHPLLAEEIREIDVRAPSGAIGVVASVAVIGGPAPGFVTAFACGDPVPGTSSINFAANLVSANTVVSRLGNQMLCVWASSEAHLIVDVTGYLSPAGELSHQALAPRRLLDTRSATSLYTGRLGARQVIELPIQGLPGMPGGVWAVTANLTSVGASGPGFLTAFPCGGAVPPTSSLNFTEDGAVGALTVSAVGPGGKLCVFASTRTHLIVDLAGVWVHTGPSPAPPPPPTDANDPADNGDPGDPGTPTDPTDPTDPGTPGVDGGSNPTPGTDGGQGGDPTVSPTPGTDGDPTGNPGEDRGDTSVRGVGQGCATGPGAPGSAPIVLGFALLLAGLLPRRRSGR